MFDTIEKADQSLFLYLNQFHTPTWDTIMWHVSGKFEWIPLYAILLFLVIKNYRMESWKVILGVALVVVLADQISVKLFKDVIQRYRPCHNLELESIVHIVNQKCGGKYGFISSHATNTFAVASYMGLILKSSFSKIPLMLLIWAAIVSYSRIYLGVHYPLDIIGGAAVGTGIGYLVYLMVSKYLNRTEK